MFLIQSFQELVQRARQFCLPMTLFLDDPISPQNGRLVASNLVKSRARISMAQMHHISFGIGKCSEKLLIDNFCDRGAVNSKNASMNDVELAHFAKGKCSISKRGLKFLLDNSSNHQCFDLTILNDGNHMRPGNARPALVN